MHIHVVVDTRDGRAVVAFKTYVAARNWRETYGPSIYRIDYVMLDTER